MRVRLAKELRELAVPWAQGVGLALFLLLLRPAGDMALGTLGLLCFYLSGRLFGAELDYSTLPRLLAQPISRLRVLWEKELAVALLMALGFGLVLAAIVLTGHELPIRMDLVVLTLLVGLASGPALALLIGNSLQAFWVSLALPFLVYVIAWNLLREPETLSLPAVFLPYSAVILALGIHRLRVLELGGRDGRARSIEVASRSRHRVSELILKELRLQRSALLLVPVAVVSWCLVLLPSLGSDPGYMLRILADLSSLTLVAIVPALVGASAVAGERQLGVLTWQLALPVSRRLQWGVKAAVCVALTLVTMALGLGLYGLTAPQDRLTPGNRLIISTLLSGTALLAGLYGSKLTRSPFRALGLAPIFAAIVAYTATQLSFVVGLSRLLGWLPDPLDVLHTFVSLTPLAVLAVMALAIPRQELWLSARKLRHAAGFAALSTLLVAALGLQIAGLETISATLERQITMREHEIARLDLPEKLGWLTEALELEVESYRAEELVPILEFAGARSGTNPELVHSGYHRPLSSWLRIFIRIDGFAASGSLDRWFWTRALRGYPTRSEIKLSEQIFYSIAPLWRQQHRREQLDRYIRLEAVLEALRVGEVLKKDRDLDPQRFRQLTATSGPDGFG